jgi:hypothetical protein
VFEFPSNSKRIILKFGDPPPLPPEERRELRTPPTFDCHASNMRKSAGNICHIKIEFNLTSPPVAVLPINCESCIVTVVASGPRTDTADYSKEN